MASSSPASNRPNPNSRNSEINNPIRMSFSGNPFKKPSTVANSPSEIGRRNSVGGRESVASWADHDDKENGREQNPKPARVRSPAASKSTKHFMSPTVSASSKVTVSPRKKILHERNEPVRPSVSSCDSKSPFRKVTFAELPEEIDSKGEIGLEEELLESLTVPMNSQVPDFKVPLSSKTEPELLVKIVTEEQDCVNLDPTFNISPTPPLISSHSTLLAPLDADPLMPPYDPKTTSPYDPERNYMSPRPQFLCYRPHPRVKYDKERGGIRTEESSMSGSFSDIEVTEETQSEYSQTEAEDVSSGEIVKEEESFEAKGSSKPHSFTRSKLVALFLVLSITCLSASFKNTTMVDPTVFKSLDQFYNMYASSDIPELAKANFDRLARNFHLWYASSMFSISDLMFSFRGVHEWDHLPYYNLTGLHGDIPVDGSQVFDNSDKGIVPPKLDPSEVNRVEDEAGLEYENDEDIGDASRGSYGLAYEEQMLHDIIVHDSAEKVSEEYRAPKIETEQGVGDASRGYSYGLAYEEQMLHDIIVHDSAEKVSEEYRAPKIETQQGVGEASRGYYSTSFEEDEQYHVIVNNKDEKVIEEYGDPESVEVLEVQLANVIKPDSSELDEALQQDEVNKPSDLRMPQAQETVPPADDVNFEEQGKAELNGQPVLNSYIAETHTDILEAGEFHVECGDMELTISEEITTSSDAASLVNKQNPRAVDLPPNVLAILLLVVPLIAATIFNYSRKDKSRTRRDGSREKQFEKKLDRSLPGNCPSVVDMVGESCPSEMSSFQKYTSYSSRGLKSSNKAQSVEKKPNKNLRRESLASSADYSMSSSYGSFTTYEKIPSKNGHGDEEVITPVRRSSRIRKVTSS